MTGLFALYPDFQSPSALTHPSFSGWLFSLVSIFISMLFQQVLADDNLWQFAMYMTPELNNENCELVERRTSQNE